MVSFLFCLYLSGPVELKHAHTMRLNVPFAPTLPTVWIDHTSNIWYASFWDDAVYKLNADGKELFRIEGPGPGPGEIHKPYIYTLVNDNQHLLLLHKRTVLTLFDAEDGSFIRDVIKFQPLARLWPWDENHALVLISPTASAYHGFGLVRLSDGEVVKRWFKLDKPESVVTSGSMAFSMRADRTIFYQAGTRPHVNIIQPFQDDPIRWHLKPPPGYVEPPDKPLPEKDRYSRIKVDAFYNSFTEVKQFFLLHDRYLIVNWKNVGESSYHFQLYDAESRTLLHDNLDMQGVLLHANDGFIYTLERIDSADLDVEAKDLLHRYTFNGPAH